MRQILFQNATTILLQKATKVYYKMCQVVCYKMWQFYYELRQLLQNASILLQNVAVITNCDVSYKIRRCKLPLVTFSEDVWNGHSFELK